MNGRRGRARRAESDDLVSRIKDARVFLPTEMPLPALVELVNDGLSSAIRAVLSELQPYERRTTRVNEIRVEEREKLDGNVRYMIGVGYEHDCPNGVCDDCIGND
jgi:hypothetical protein